MFEQAGFPRSDNLNTHFMYRSTVPVPMAWIDLCFPDLLDTLLTMKSTPNPSTSDILASSFLESVLMVAAPAFFHNLPLLYYKHYGNKYIMLQVPAVSTIVKSDYFTKTFAPRVLEEDIRSHNAITNPQTIPSTTAYEPCNEVYTTPQGFLLPAFYSPHTTPSPLDRIQQVCPNCYT